MIQKVINYPSEKPPVQLKLSSSIMILQILSSHCLQFSLLLSFASTSLGVNVSSINFNYPTFLPDHSGDFSFFGGSYISEGSLQLTPRGNLVNQSARVLHNEIVKLWRNNGSVLTSFNTSFMLSIKPITEHGGEGLAFIITNVPAPPSNSSGMYLGLVNSQLDGFLMNRIVAVEFDTRKSYASDLNDNHVGVDANSIYSIEKFSLSESGVNLSSGSDISVTIQYHGIRRTLAIHVSLASGSEHEDSSFSTVVPMDLQLYLLEDACIGFSGSTSEHTELNIIKSWSFSTTEGAAIEDDSAADHLLWLWLLMLVTVVPVGVAFLQWKRKGRLSGHRRKASLDIESMIEDSTEGPHKMRLKALKAATANFDPKRELGEGGSGTVYKGYLEGTNKEVAVKRLPKGLNRGEREFMAEVTVISRLSHRNLVKLIGWCHEESELLLVFEFMPNGSLDKLLYPQQSSTSEAMVLSWERRYKIIHGVASALDYLHHGCNKRVLHRDVKPSNVLLDCEYSARLGDFGLARFIQVDGKTHHSTNAIAGTRGYMAPECFLTGRASPETDTYAFGVLAMEVVCGQRPGHYIPYCNSNSNIKEGRVADGDGSHYIVDRIWDLYGSGKLIDAVDPGLKTEYDELQISCVLRLALACCHPNPRERPSMKVAMQVLNGGAPPLHLPAEKPASLWSVINNHCEIHMPYADTLFPGGQLTQSVVSGR